MSLKKLVFVAAKRTPFGAFGGTLKDFSATDLAVHAATACLKQSGVDPKFIDSVCVGNVVQSDRDAIYLARHVGLKAGVPIPHTSLTVNRLCGSGFEAIAQGAYRILCEDESAALVGGSESMTRVPYILRGARYGYRMGNGELEDYLSAALVDTYTGLPMAITAENLAVKHGFTRAQVDELAVMSQARAGKAWTEGVYKDEVSPITIKSKKGDVEFAKDEHMRPDATLEGLAKLKPVFKADGVVTAGNASGIVDGAAMLVLCSEEFAKAHGLKVLGTLINWAAAGCEPKEMGIGPVPSTLRAMENYKKKTGKTLSISDFKRVEINEAFSAQYLAVEKELGLSRERTNVNGGAIAIGHPLAASGARLVGHLLYDLARKGGGLGLASACIGGGQGMSMIVEVN